MYGLVLEGGGTRGAYQIGAYEALMEEGIEIGGIAGTSIGALNGSLLVQDKFHVAKDLWERLEYSMLINATDEEIEKLNNLSLDKESFSYIAKSFKEIVKEGGLDITPLKELIDEHVDEEAVRNSPMDFGMVTVNVSDLKSEEVFIEDIPEGSLKNYLLASAYLPVFKSEKLDGNYYLDGAFYDNLPFSMLKEKGYEKLILIRVHGSGIVKKIEPGENDIIISPREDLGMGLECDSEKSKYNMKLGYYDTLRVLNDLKGDKYYFDIEKSEEECFEFFLNLKSDKIKALQQVLKTEIDNPRRSMFEEIIPRLAMYLDLGSHADYRDIYAGLIEVLATNMELERFKVYKENEVLEFIKTGKLRIKDNSDKGIFNKLIKTVENMTSLNREEILIKSSDIILR